MKQNEFEKASQNEKDNLLKEYVDFLKQNKKWWLIPILLSFLFFGLLLVLGGSGAAPFIYTLF